MNASRTQANRRVDFSATTCSIHSPIVEFVKRRGQASLPAITRHFSGTPGPFVVSAVNKCIDDGTLTIRRNGLSRRAGYVYQVTE